MINYGLDFSRRITDSMNFGGFWRRSSCEQSDGTPTPFQPSGSGSSSYQNALLDSNNNLLVTSTGDVLTYLTVSTLS